MVAVSGSRLSITQSCIAELGLSQWESARQTRNDRSISGSDLYQECQACSSEDNSEASLGDMSSFGELDIREPCHRNIVHLDGERAVALHTGRSKHAEHVGVFL